MAKRKTKLQESIVIYISEEDGCWIAHSLKTDQIGTGDRIVDALAEVLKAIHAIVDEASGDGTLAILRNAPREIQEMAKKARLLPMEIFEVAHKMVHGEWPKDWNPPVPKNEGARTFKTRVDELSRA